MLCKTAVSCQTLAASGHPHEYHVETFHSYGALLFGNSTFMRFFNDPAIQTWLHVRGGTEGRPLPGLNFPVEEGEGEGEGEGQLGPAGQRSFVPAGWQACNEQIDVDMRGDHPTSSVPAIRFVANHIRSVGWLVSWLDSTSRMNMTHTG